MAASRVLSRLALGVHLIREPFALSSVSQVACAGRSVRKPRTTKPSRTAGIASSKNIHCQPLRPKPSSFQQGAGDRSRDEAGDRSRSHKERNAAPVTRREPVGEIKDNPRERSRLRQRRAGSAKHRNCSGPITKANSTEMMPQVIMTRAIQRRAPKRSRIRLLGTSKRK